MLNGDWQLTHWGRMTHICVSELTIIGPDNGLSPGRRQAIIWTNAGIYIIIMKNFPHLLWNRRAWCFFRDTYLTIEVQGIRCTNHLHDSCPFTDVNPHLNAPGADIISKLTADGLLWRHRHMGQPLAIVTSQWPIVPTGIYGRMMLRSARVKEIAITRETLNCLAHCSGGWKVEIMSTNLYIVIGWPITACWFNILVYFPLHFRTPVFQHGASLVLLIRTLGTNFSEI